MSIFKYSSFDWQKRLKFALSLMEFVFKMDEMKPEPLRMCKMKISNFGVTGDKRYVIVINKKVIPSISL